MKRKSGVAVGAALAVFVAGGVYFFKGRAPEAQAELPVETAQRRTIEVVAEASGVLEPIRLIEVKSKASGEVLRVEGETGARIEAGTLLVEIDPRDVKNAFQQAAADLEAARVRFSTTDAQRKRLSTLRESGVVTQQELEASVETAASARAALVRAETNLQLAQERQGDAIIRAPISGTLIERTVEPGQIIASATTNVSGGTLLFKMADLSAMQVRAKVDETDIGTLAPGQTAKVTVEAYPGRTFEGQVLKIEPQSVIEQNVTLFPVLIRLDNASGLLRPGMNAQVSVEIAKREQVVSISNGSVVTLREARAAASAAGVDPVQLQEALKRPSSMEEAHPLMAECRAMRASVEGSVEVMDPERKAQLERCEALRAQRKTEGVKAGGSRPGVVFVKGGSGVEARRVMLGLADWDHTEVLQGLEEGASVVQVSLAQLGKRKQEMTDEIRKRAGGVVPGAGGGGPRGGRGG